MNGKRILPWEDDDWNWRVETRIGNISIVRDEESGEWSAQWVYDDADDWIGDYPDVESAITACEADYIARCSEFLRVAGPGECVVKAADLETAVNELRDLCGPDCTSVAKLTAAFCHPAHLMESLHTYDPQAQFDFACRSMEGGEHE